MHMALTLDNDSCFLSSYLCPFRLCVGTCSLCRTCPVPSLHEIQATMNFSFIMLAPLPHHHRLLFIINVPFFMWISYLHMMAYVMICHNLALPLFPTLLHFSCLYVSVNSKTGFLMFIFVFSMFFWFLTLPKTKV